MNLVAAATELLSMRLGLSPELLGDGVIERALDVVFAKAVPEDRNLTAARLLEDEGEEWQMLVDEIIVPETWFFRHSESFLFLASYVIDEWCRAHPVRPFLALCVPCASGEEPYSVVMTLLDAGLDASRIRVDAADVSERLLERAKLAVYGKASFREKGNRSREKYFIICEEGWRVREGWARLVRFEKANLLALSLFSQRAPYDAIFCRNALIYLDERARREVVSQLSELLDENGLLFTGSSELTHFCEAGYVPVDFPQSFACRKGKPTRDRAPGSSITGRVAAAVVRRTTPTRPTSIQEVMPPVAVHPAPELPPSLEQAERLADRGELDAAVAVCRRLLEVSTQSPDVYALLGVISESQEKVVSAEEFFRKALYLAPGHYASLVHMSLLCERRGDAEGSRRYRARAGRALIQQDGKEVLKGA